VGIKRPGREADYLPPSSAEVKSAWSYTSTPQYVFMAALPPRKRAPRTNWIGDWGGGDRDHSSPFSVKIKMHGAVPPLSRMYSCRGT
jgi:hypothetical protein